MADPTEADKRRSEEAVVERQEHERDPAPLGGENRPYDPDTGEVGTTTPRSAAPIGSAGSTGVVPPRGGATPAWRRPALFVGAVALIILLLFLLT